MCTCDDSAHVCACVLSTLHAWWPPVLGPPRSSSEDTTHSWDGRLGHPSSLFLRGLGSGVQDPPTQAQFSGAATHAPAHGASDTRALAHADRPPQVPGHSPPGAGSRTCWAGPAEAGGTPQLAGLGDTHFVPRPGSGLQRPGVSQAGCPKASPWLCRRPLPVPSRGRHSLLLQ